MFSRAIRRQRCFTACQSISLPPTFLLPLRARLTTVTHTTNPNPPGSSYRSSPLPTPKSPLSPNTPSEISPPQATASSESPETASISSLLPLLAAQPPHYIIAHLHDRPYLLTAGDTLRLPFHMHSAPPGTVLRLTRASVIGSRDYTFRGLPWVDPKYFVCRARVVGIEGEPMRIEKKTKRRQRRVKTVKNKMRFTVLRCFELKVLKDGEIERQEETDDQSSNADSLEW